MYGHKTATIRETSCVCAVQDGPKLVEEYICVTCIGSPRWACASHPADGVWATSQRATNRPTSPTPGVNLTPDLCLKISPSIIGSKERLTWEEGEVCNSLGEEAHVTILDLDSDQNLAIWKHGHTTLELTALSISPRDKHTSRKRCLHTFTPSAALRPRMWFSHPFSWLPH